MPAKLHALARPARTLWSFVPPFHSTRSRPPRGCQSRLLTSPASRPTPAPANQTIPPPSTAQPTSTPPNPLSYPASTPEALADLLESHARLGPGRAASFLRNVRPPPTLSADGLSILAGDLARSSTVAAVQKLIARARAGGFDPLPRAMWAALVHAHVRAGQVDAAVEVVEEEMGGAADAYEGVVRGVLKVLAGDDGGARGPVDGVMYAGGVEASAVERADLQLGMRVLARMKAAGRVPTVAVYTHLMRAHGETEQFMGIPELLEDMRVSGVAPDAATYAAAAAGFARNGDVSRIRLIISRMAASGIIGEELVVQTALAEALVRRSDAAGALAVLEDLKRRGPAPDVRVYSIVINGLLGKRQRRAAETLFREMISRGIKPDAIAYNTFLGHLARRGEVDRARALLAEMQRSGVTPTAVSFNAVMNACSHASDAVLAGHTLDAMLDAGLIPDAITFSTLAALHARRRDPLRAEGILDAMRATGVAPTVEVFTPVIHCWLQVGKRDEARRVLGDMRRDGVEADEVLDHILVDGGVITLGEAFRKR
ncbi:hypothetical protein BDK51DRAFT_41706 [Blyttiomyces helicus]|uniref:Pentacotripeptide-repeat region of PRORP domain-containing protein n=1 Tax=Blyttiomyces helicus TaxID=388810 RepID=A0A4P9W6B5_9FUNG|nr:hypothetical protein BDK51DRAFT_41706 [Blyttiomyces helicus]|eukprot:RKO86468.1 hypothetical protein BDK51DRAFT_41706 [Blyttiomyces helicus]